MLDTEDVGQQSCCFCTKQSKQKHFHVRHTPILIALFFFTLFPWRSVKISVHSLSQGNEFVVCSSVHVQETHRRTHHTLERVVSRSLGTQMMGVATGETVVFVVVHTCKHVFQHV
jgi:hypothetical protein